MSPTARAHFVWIATVPEGKEVRPCVFFSEGPSERDYHLPEKIAASQLAYRTADGSSGIARTESREEEAFTGLRAHERFAPSSVFTTQADYGIYHGKKLVYYAKHVATDAEADWKRLATSMPLELDAYPVKTPQGLDLFVTWQGRPVESLEVSLLDPNGERVRQRTDKQGRASFASVPSGLFGFLVGHEDKDARGAIEGESYTGVMRYLTLTVPYSVGEVGVESRQEAAGVGEQSTTTGMEEGSADPSAAAGGVPALPEGLASFGAAVHDRWLYIYGGHTGTPHSHSRDNLSQAFRRLRLAGGTWQDLPMETPLQGMALVAHGKYLYRVGGMQARNAADEDDDLHSVDEFARFDPSRGVWERLTPLPEPRSSHDAVVIGDTLYVVGGWNLTGSDEGEWHTTAWRRDLRADDAAWEALPAPPFQRRALAVASLPGKLVALCGMDSDDEISREVDAYDIGAGTWEKLPDLPGSGMLGFGIAAWTVGERLMASGTDGVVYRFDTKHNQWLAGPKLATPRFFHRLLPMDESRLLAIAGSSLGQGHLSSIEIVAAP